MSLTVVGTGLLLSELDNLFRTLLPMPAGMADFFMKLAGGRTSLWGSILVSVVIAPLTEESLFRGLILRGFLSRYTVNKAIIISAVLFGLFHLNPWQFLPATLLGVIFAWWFVRTGSLLPCLFGHALTNAVPLILMGILHIEISGLTSEPTQVEFQPLWLDLIGLLCTASGIWLLIHRFGKSRAFDTEQIAQ
jgi:membrane protease YdiL (CAAX protease family)